MKKVAKLVIIDKDNNYLLMYRSNHPTFGDDPDLPGGTLEDGESALEAMVREVYEEIGVTAERDAVKEVYSGTDYSTHDTYYSLFISKLEKRLDITMSWEHTSYSWLSRDEFLKESKSANDTYMHMVYDIIKDVGP